MESKSDILAVKSNKDQSFQDTLTTIHKFLTQENKIELIKYIKEIHNADLAEIIQNLDDDNRSKFIITIKDSFDPEILTIDTLFGAAEKSRTSTGIIPQRPQRCASTSSATTAIYLVNN